MPPLLGIYTMGLIIVGFTAALIAVLLYATFKGISQISGWWVREQYREYTVLRCPKCGYTKVREFRVGDYVGKVDDEKCPNDGSNLVVSSIGSSQGQYT